MNYKLIIKAFLLVITQIAGFKLIVIGLGLLIMSLFGKVPEIMIWVYQWGNFYAYLIMTVYVICGGAIFYLIWKNNERMKHRKSAKK